MSRVRAQLSVRSLAGVIALVALSFTLHRVWYRPDELVPLCSVSSASRMTRLHVANLLQAEGITPAYQERMVAGHFVPRRQFTRAVRALQDGTAMPGSTLVLTGPSDGEFPHSASCRHSREFNRTYGNHVDEIVRGPADECARLIGTIRQSAKSQLNRLPYVRSLHGYQTRYLSGDQVYRTGFSVHIVLTDNPTNPTELLQQHFHVLEDFTSVH